MKKSLKFKPSSLLFLLFLIPSFCSYVIFSSTESSQFEKVSKIISDLSLNDTSTESLNIDLVFKGSPDFQTFRSAVDTTRSYNLYKTTYDKYNFRAMYNANINEIIKFDGFDDYSFSFLPHNVTSTHFNAKNETVLDWFDLKLMFSESFNVDYSQCDSFVEIREETAKKILKDRGEEYNYDNCLNLCQTPNYLTGTYSYDGVVKAVKYQIRNIILENSGGSDSTFYSTYGDYVCIYNFNRALPSFKGYSINFDFGTSFYNTYEYLKLIENIYPRADYDYLINDYNSSKTQNFYDRCDEVLRLWENTSGVKYTNKYLAAIITIAIFAAIGLLSFITAFKKDNWSMFGYLFLFISFSIPYFVFWIIGKSSLLLMNYFSSSAIFLIFALFLVSFIVYSIFRVRRIKQSKKNVTHNSEIDYYEVSI